MRTRGSVPGHLAQRDPGEWGHGGHGAHVCCDQVYDIYSGSGLLLLNEKGEPDGAGRPQVRGFERKLQKKVHNGSENSENKKKYGVAEKSVKKSPDLGPNGIGHNSG